jgi:hypothetical protein
MLGARNGVFWGYNEHPQANNLPEAIIPRRFWLGEGESWEDYGARNNIPGKIDFKHFDNCGLNYEWRGHLSNETRGKLQKREEIYTTLRSWIRRSRSFSQRWPATSGTSVLECG